MAPPNQLSVSSVYWVAGSGDGENKFISPPATPLIGYSFSFGTTRRHRIQSCDSLLSSSPSNWQTISGNIEIDSRSRFIAVQSGDCPKNYERSATPEHGRRTFHLALGRHEFYDGVLRHRLIVENEQCN